MLKTRYYQTPGLNRAIERDTGPLGAYRRPGVHGYESPVPMTEREARWLAWRILTRRAIRRRRALRPYGDVPHLCRYRP